MKLNVGAFEMKNYFLQDSELHDSDEDYFRHLDVAENITKIIRNTTPPFNIAVIGKWGLGKSSLINLATKEFEEDNIVININAWKYEKESLSKVFLRQVLNKLDQSMSKKLLTRTEEQVASLRKVFSSSGDSKNKDALGKRVVNFFKANKKPIIVYIIISFVVYLIYSLIRDFGVNGGMYYTTIRRYAALVLVGYLKNSTNLIVIPGILIVLTGVLEDIKDTTPNKTLGIEPLEMNVEDYETALSNKLQEVGEFRKKQGKTKQFKTIIILDDLDRLSAQKMVEALDAIKMFMNFNNCIFIVPFDDSILKYSISKNRQQYANQAEADEFLDKLFQYKIYLAPLLPFDIKKYALTLCHAEIGDFITEYCQEEYFDNAVRKVLIYPDVTTPRQVKKIINTFVAYMMLAQKREKAEKVSKGFATEPDGIYTIAKLSVLQADFNEFFDYLFDDSEAIIKVLDAQQTQKWNELPQELLVAIHASENKEESDYSPSDQTMRLLSYLAFTRSFGRGDLAPYLYVTLDDITRVVGSKAQRDFIKAAESGNIIECKSMIEAEPELSLAAEYNIVNYSNLDNSYLINMICVISEMASLLETKRRVEIGNVLADKAQVFADNWNEKEYSILNVAGILDYYNSSNNKAGYSPMLKRILVPVSDWKCADKLRYFGTNYNILSEDIKPSFDLYIVEVLENNWLNHKEFIEIKEKSGLDDSAWREKYFNFLIKRISGAKDFSTRTIEELKAVFYEFDKNEYSMRFGEMNPLFGELELSKFLHNVLSSINKDNRIIEDTSMFIYQQVQSANDDEQENDEVNRNLIDFNYDISSVQVSGDDEKENAEQNIADTFDQYFLKNIGSTEMLPILENYFQNNDVRDIEETVAAIIDKGFANRDEGTIECIKSLIGKEQTIDDKIWAKLDSNIRTPYTNFSGIAELLVHYRQLNTKKVDTSITSAIRNISGSSVSDQYLVFLKDYFLDSFSCMQAEDKGNSALLAEFVSKLVYLINNGRNLQTAISSICSLENYISDESFVNSEPAIYKHLDDDNIDIIYSYFDSRSYLFEENANKLPRTHLLDVYLRTLRGTNLKGKAINSLIKKFRTVDKWPELAMLVYTEEEDNAKAYQYVKDSFINELEEAKSRDDSTNSSDLDLNTEQIKSIKNLLEIIPKTSLEYVNKFLGEQSDNIQNQIAAIVTKSPDAFTYEDIRTLFEWIQSENNANCKTLVSLFAELVDIASESNQYEELVGLLKVFSSIGKKSDRLGLITPAINLMNRMTSANMKKEVYSICRDLKIQKEIRNQMPQHLKEILEENS